MTTVLALFLFIVCMLGLLGFVRFCMWILSRRDITS